jgi:4-hydroxy-3-polyprenylbenzoate decarboxylase
VNTPLVLGVTGASGAPYALRLIRALIDLQVPTYLIISTHGWRLLRLEAEIDDEEELRARLPGDWSGIEFVSNSDRGAVPASGSVVTRGMVVCPCSMGTLAAITHGNSRSLIERAADVTLKERRRLVLVPRETPLSQIHLRNMLEVSRAGAVVMPAAPGFYGRPQSIDELVDFIVARVLDHVGIEHEIGKRWSGQ